MKQFFNHPIFRLFCLTVLIYVLIPKTVFGYTLCAAAIAFTAGIFFFLNQKGFFADQKALHHKGDWLLSLAAAFGMAFLLYYSRRNLSSLAALPFFIFAVHSFLLLVNTFRSRSQAVQAVIAAGAAGTTVLFSYLQVQFSAMGNTHGFLLGSKGLLLFNIVCILIVYLLTVACSRRLRGGMWLACLIFGLWSVADYYVILYHGSPLFLSEFRNARTALSVIGGFSFSLTVPLLILLGIMVFNMFVILWAVPPVKLSRKSTVTACAPLLFSVIAVGLFRYRDQNDYLFWSWRDGISSGGYFSCLLEDAERLVKPFRVPDGYTAMDENVCISPQDASLLQKPDIVFILNETFFDIKDYLDITTDTDYRHNFYSLANSVTGRAIVPAGGGCTNNSEFELLTSKSMSLLSAGAPFNYVDFHKANSSIVSYLKEYGYHTTAMHCGNKINYARNTAYPAIGFDQVFLGVENFYCRYNGNRMWLDEDNFGNMISYYKNNISESSAPQFMYMVTYQNHAGYEMNPPELDTVHAYMDGVPLSDDINEYLSSVSLSFQAFETLTNFFEKQTRPVIVCMVGDHSAPFLNSMLEKYTDLDELALEVAVRKVPYIIWSNFDLDYSGFSKVVSMVDLAPLVVSSAKLQVTPFYQKVLDLHDVFPIRTSIGIVGDASGKLSLYDANQEQYRKLTEYYSLEYDSLVTNDHYNPRFFLPQIIK